MSNDPPRTIKPSNSIVQENSTNLDDDLSDSPSQDVATDSNSTEETNGSYTYQHATESILWAMGVNLTIAILKIGGWWLSKSPSMLSEGLHTFGDTINSVALYIGVRLSNKKADPTHPFGYGLEASVWAIPACVLLLVFSVVAGYEGWQQLIEGPHQEVGVPIIPVDPYYFSAGILLVSIGLELVAVQKAAVAVLEEFNMKPRGLTFGVFQAMGQVRHVVGPTTRFVFYEDTVALVGSSLALCAITVTHFAELYGWLAPEFVHFPDAIISIVIAIMLAIMSIYLFFHNRMILTGTSASPQIEQEINNLVSGLHEVSEVHDLVVIDRGPAGLSVHLDVEVEPDMPVKDVDDLTDKIKDRLSQRIKNVHKDQINVEVLADETEQEWGEQFVALIEQGRIDEVIKPREESILKNVYDFTQITVEDIIVPRTDVIAIEADATVSSASDLLLESGHSRLPVYEDSMDTVLGIIHSRDMFKAILDGQGEQSIRSLIREVPLYPETKPVSDLLEEFKRKKLQMALIMDEHGGLAGIVTIEDLMEEIVGEIWDEHDEDERELIFVSNNEVLVSGKYDIDDLNEELTQNIPNEEFTTIAGYVFGEIGREPVIDDQIEFEDLTISVSAVEGVRITQLKIISTIPFKRKPVESEES